MRIDVCDAQRRSIGRIEVNPARRPTRVHIDGTDREVFLDWDTALDDGHRLRRCVVCGCNDLFRAKAFPQITGFVVVLAFAGAIVGALGPVNTLTLITMVVVLVADVSILLFSRQRLVCHRCRSSYHGLPIARYHRRWDRAVAERHAPPTKPSRLIGGRRPILWWPRRPAFVGTSGHGAREPRENHRMTSRPPLLLLGGGGHAAVVADSARVDGWIIAGFLDDDRDEQRARRLGLTRLGAIADLASLLGSPTGDRPGPVGHAAVGRADLRRQWLDALGAAAAAAIVHPSAVISPSADLADGVFVGPRAVVNARSQVHRGAIVNSGAIVEHDCTLGPFCHIAPGATLAGGVTIGQDALVGINAAVLPGLRIGDAATLGAGSVATSDLPDGATAAGIRARRVPPAETAAQARG